MDDAQIARTAGYLAEAFETGNPLAPLPRGLAPRDTADAEAIMAAVLERLGLVPCGVRVAPAADGSWIAGPMLDGRLLPNGSTLALSALRHPHMTAAVIGVLAEPLAEDGNGPPVLSAIHPAIDVAASRFRDGPEATLLMAADLGGLGHVVAGAAARPPAGPVPVTLAQARRRPAGTATDVTAALARAAAVARRMGGLPAGAVLVAAGLSPPIVPAAEETWVAGLGPLGRARLGWVAGASASNA